MQRSRRQPWIPLSLGGVSVWLLVGAFSAPVAPPALIAADAPAETAGGEARPEHPRYFELHIAPLLARRCLECHDAAIREGGLDISRRATALAGGESGPAIVPGDASKSPAWLYVEAGEMPPQNRPPLDDREKSLLKEWIEAGAVWPGDEISAAALTRDPRAAERWPRRLTVEEYIETVRSATGVEVEREARRLLPRDVRADGFSNTAYNLQVGLEHVESYAELAGLIAARIDMPAFLEEHLETDCRNLEEACLREVIAGVGRWVLRGPLEAREIDGFLRVARAVEREGGDFHEAIRYVLEAMLQSPRFIYRIEAERGGGAPPGAASYELASRMSYILWGGPPDKPLLQAAAAGRLEQRAGIEAQVERMLADPRAVQRSTRFVHEWLGLDRLENLAPQPDRFPDWNAELAADMAEETRAFFEEVVWKEQRPLWDLLNAQVTLVSPRLAAHYGLEPSRAESMDRRRPGSIRPPDDGGLLALYRFDADSGRIVRDVSGAGEPLDLRIEDPAAVEWTAQGLRVTGTTRIATPGPARRLTAAIQASGAFTIETWVTPENDTQQGPARLVSLSAGSTQRNVTLGQDGRRYEARSRTTAQGDNNGLPAARSPADQVALRPTHVVYTRTPAGAGLLYVDGEEAANHVRDGSLDNWDTSFPLMLANETGGDRPWRGTYHEVAVYDRDLSPREIRARGQPTLRYDLRDVPARGGLLTHAGVLTIGGDEASMVARGLFVLHDVLHSAVGNAPACVDTTPIPARPGMSRREVAETRLSNSSCNSCHARFEPLAFGLERFNGIGAFSEFDEHGNRQREDGKIVLPGSARPVEYESIGQLMDLLAESDRVRMTITRKAVQFALGRPLVESDAAAVREIHAAGLAGGGTYGSLMQALILSDLVRTPSKEPLP